MNTADFEYIQDDIWKIKQKAIENYDFELSDKMAEIWRVLNRLTPEDMKNIVDYYNQIDKS